MRIHIRTCINVCIHTHTNCIYVDMSYTLFHETYIIQHWIPQSGVKLFFTATLLPKDTDTNFSNMIHAKTSGQLTT